MARLKIEFEKVDDGRACRWVATRRRRQTIVGPTMAAGPDLPHDLMTFVIESDLQANYGFFGLLAAGATFRSTSARRTPAGVAIITEHNDDLERVEATVNAAYFQWRGDKPQLVDRRLLTSSQPAIEQALDAMLARWQALADSESINLTWPQTAH